MREIWGVLDLEILRVIRLLRSASLNQGKVGKRSAFPLLNQVRKSNVLNSVVASLIMSDSTAHLKMIHMKSTSTSHQHSHSRCTIVFCINILTPCFFRAGHVTCPDHTTLDGGALRHAPLRLLDLESVCSGRSDQSDWLYQVQPKMRYRLISREW